MRKRVIYLYPKALLIPGLEFVLGEGGIGGE
jgi:hypothetical protein